MFNSISTIDSYYYVICAGIIGTVNYGCRMRDYMLKDYIHAGIRLGTAGQSANPKPFPAESRHAFVYKCISNIYQKIYI